MIVELRRRTILADRALARRSTRALALVHTGLDSTAIASAAAIAAASSKKTESAQETMDALFGAIACLRKDVTMDACADWYGDECEGTDPEVDRVAECLYKLELGTAGTLTPVTWQDALRCAGMEPTEENKAAFAECVKKKESASGSVPRGTLGVCAMVVRRGAGSKLAHSTQAWRDKLETFERSFGSFREKWGEKGGAGEVGLWDAATGVSASDVEPYAKEYNAFREQFIGNGGSTSCQEIETPGTSKWVWIVGAVVVFAVGSIVLWQVKTVASLAKAATA